MSQSTIEPPAPAASAPAAKAPVSPAPLLSMEVFHSFASLESLRDEWDQLAVRTQSPVFLSFDWARTWWEFYGGGKRLCIYVCRVPGEGIVGILPLFVESVGVWPLPMRVARIVSANLPPQVLEPPVREEYATEVYGRVIVHLMKDERCDVISLGLVTDAWAGALALAAACALRPHLVEPPAFRATEVNTVFHFPDTYDEYINGLDSRERKIRRKKLRDLEADKTLRLEVIQDDQRVIGEFEQFAEQHTGQWQAEGRPGHFGAWPRGLEFHRALVAAHAKLKRVRFTKLFAGDVVAANQYTFAFGEAIYALLPSRISDPEWHRYSLGGTSQIKLIESSINDGFRRLESGLGHYEYKVLLNGKETPAGMIRVVRTGSWARMKVRFYDGIARALTFLLHKVWYRRIAPRLRGCATHGRPAILLRFEF